MDTTSELLELVHRIGHRARHGYRRSLEPLGLSPGQARAMRELIEAGRPLRMVQLAEALRIVPRSLTPVVDALEEAGLVRREIDPANRRSTLLLITTRGEEVYEQARQARREVARELFGGLSQEQREILRELLGTVEQA
ncbi:MarR family winged helix-turn-helix transcriptional regulator [Nonomuraea dietziae]|uniref:MarR family winged helix-turn-helix transcriptional regulator n=1 Tax=Nonomuraea dietziae TaxID=65515 RepID=UPI0033CBADBF